jgi:hypothetical protein
MTLHRIASALAACIVFSIAPFKPALALELSHNAQQIKGSDARSGVSFQSTLTSGSQVTVDTYVGTKQIHAEIDYAAKTLSVSSLLLADKSLAAMAPQDIAAFQTLRLSLPARLGAEDLHADALSSLVNLVASAPAGSVIKIAVAKPDYTSICPLVGNSDTATYTLTSGVQNVSVTVGPVCYAPPALGRCGAGAGPDPGIGLAQRFTQQCLNHDQCCVATQNRYLGGADICGKPGTNECVPEFVAAAAGFFFAPDCGATSGYWVDNTGAVWALTGRRRNGSGRKPRRERRSSPAGVRPLQRQWATRGHNSRHDGHQSHQRQLRRLDRNQCGVQ